MFLAINRFSLCFLVICFLFFSIFPKAFGQSSECIKSDCVNGEGTYVDEKGRIYEGQWKDGLLHGPVFEIEKGFKMFLRYKNGIFNESDWECNISGGSSCDFSDRFHRIILLIELTDSINCLNDLIPNPKPSEIEWVNKEQNKLERLIEEANTNAMKTKILTGDRYQALTNSDEYMKIKLKQQFEEYLSLIENIRKAHEESSLREEMINWAIISHKILEDERYWDWRLPVIKEVFWKSYKKEDNTKCNIYWDPDQLMQPWSGNHLKGLSIYESMVIPYLKGKITK